MQATSHLAFIELCMDRTAELTKADLARLTNASRQRICTIMRVFSAMGVVTIRHEGRRTFYRVDPTWTAAREVGRYGAGG